MTGFRRVVCGIDGNRAALEGARQAAALAGPDSTIELVAVANALTVGPAATEPTELSPDEVLTEAAAEVASAPAVVITRSVDSEGMFTWDRLVDVAAGADLLVLGRPHLSRREGIVRGDVVTYVLNRAELPVLAAATPPSGLGFPGRILVAADGPGHPEDAVRLAAVIAQRSSSDVVILRVAREHAQPARAAVADAVADLTAATGSEPVEVVADGQPDRVISEYAERERASLVITGSRGKTEAAGLHGVSERVAHESPCSVLVARGPENPLRDLPYA